MMETFRLSAIDGRPIWLYRWQPDGVPRAAVLISHGLSEHAQRYGRLAADLCAAGFVVYAHDHRGHGPHAEVRGWFAEEDGWHKVLDDLHRVRSFINDSHPDLPLALFGHSMGSFIARAYFLRYGAGLSALVLSATGYRQGRMALVMRWVARRQGRRHGLREPSLFMLKLVFGGFSLMFWPRRTPADWLSRDAREVDRYLADPYCAAVPTPGLWVDFFGGIAELERGEKAGRGLPHDCPVLLVAGSRDPVSFGKFGLNQLARRYRTAGLAAVEVRVYRGGRHEMHLETNREQVVQDLVAWLQRHTATAAATAG